MKVFVLIIFLSVLLFASCGSDNDASPNTPYPNEIINNWIEVDRVLGIYKPIGFEEFPVQRFAQTYEFKENNICNFLMLSPVDAHFIVKGKWEYVKDTRRIQIYNSLDELHIEFEMLELSEEILRIK